MTSDPGLSTKPIVLVIEDELAIRRFLKAGLESHGYRLVEAVTGRDGITQTSMHTPDLVLLDLGLPDLDGFEVVRRVREWSRVPIVVLSARNAEDDKVHALDAGADDYVTKPFSMRELLARMRAAMRRSSSEDTAGEGTLELGELRVDFARRRVTLAEEEVKLTPIEYRLLTALARRAGRVLTHEQLLKEVWGPAHVSQHHYVRVYMAQLRQKLEETPARPRYLLTEPGVGYRLRES